MLASLEHAYFDGKLLIPIVKGKLNTSLDMRVKYEETITRLSQLYGALSPPPLDDSNGHGDAKVASVLRRYCSIRKELISVYRDFHTSGINFVESIPRLRTLVTLSTDLKPEIDRSDDSHSLQYQQHLYTLAHIELQFLLNINQCLWEGNRLQLPASVFHLSAAKRRLSSLQAMMPNTRRSTKLTERIDSTQSSVKLLSFMASLYSSSHGKMSLVFLHTLTSNINMSFGHVPDTDSESSCASHENCDIQDCPVGPFNQTDDGSDLVNGIKLSSTTNLAQLSEHRVSYNELPVQLSSNDLASNENIDLLEQSIDNHFSDPQDPLNTISSFNQYPLRESSEQPILNDSEYFTHIKQSIDDAFLSSIWPIMRSPKKTGLATTLLQGKRGEDEPEKLHTSSNVLRAIDTFLDECYAKIGTRPTIHIFYNAAARGFESTLNLTGSRVIAAKYLPCGHRELLNGDHLRGIKGIPCIATYPKRQPSCPLGVIAQISTLPLRDAGVLSLLPTNHYMNLKKIERPKPKVQQQSQQTKIKRRVEPADVKKLLTTTKCTDLTDVDDRKDEKSPRPEIEEPIEKTDENKETNDPTHSIENDLPEPEPGNHSIISGIVSAHEGTDAIENNADDAVNTTIPMLPSQEGAHSEMEIEKDEPCDSLMGAKRLASCSDVHLPHQNSSMLLSLQEDDGSIAGTATDVSPCAPFGGFSTNLASPPVSPRLGSFNHVQHIVDGDFVIVHDEHETKSNLTNDCNEIAEGVEETADDDKIGQPIPTGVSELKPSLIEQTVRDDDDVDKREAASPHSVAPPVTPPPSPRFVSDASFCSPPEVGSYVAATRIDLLFYFALAFDVPPQESDAAWVADWLTKFANCTTTGGITSQFFTPLTKEVCSVK